MLRSDWLLPLLAPITTIVSSVNVVFTFCKISFKRGTDVILKTIKHMPAGLSLY